MDDEPLLLSQGSKAIGPKINHGEFVFPNPSAPIFAPVVIYCVLYKTIPAIREVLEIALMVSWVAVLCFVRFLGVKDIIRAINRIAERFVNPPAPTPDAPPESD